ncbi:MAG TPA: pitrilysin family protein [Bacillota bacterium]|nr:pitrilysin family protein [Bacillota bacterium]
MYQTKTLANGLRIVCETIPHVHSVSMGIWVGTGSRYENFYYNGISHFVEHMLFKGTQRRTAKQIAEEIDAVGGQLNAFTTKEYTCYYAKLLSQHYQFGIDLLSDMVLNSVFDTREIDKEKSVVVEEINSYEDTPDELIHDLFVSNLLKNHPLGWNILGTEETISRIDRSVIQDFLRHHYTPDNTVFAVAGNIQLDQIVPEIEARFAAMEGKTDNQTHVLPRLEPGRFEKNKDTEQVHICIGTRGFARKNPRKYPVFVLDSILGGSVSSRLFQRLREECGLVYVTGSSHSSYRDTGIFSIYAGTSMKNYELVSALIREEMNKLKDETVDQLELTRAKEQIKGNLLLGLESTSNRMSRLAKMELFQDPLITPEDTVAKIDAVTSEAVLEVARELFQEENIVTSAIGPFKNRKCE